MSLLSRLTGLSADRRPLARMVDGGLVVTLPNAETPAVWRLGRDRLNGAAVQVRAQEHLWAVGLDGPDGFSELGLYRRNDDAIAALDAISAALMAAGGGPRAAPLTGFRRWAMPAVVSGALLLLVVWLLSPVAVEPSGEPAPAETAAEQAAEPPVGVPMDADSFFGGR